MPPCMLKVPQTFSVSVPDNGTSAFCASLRGPASLLSWCLGLIWHLEHEPWCQAVSHRHLQVAMNMCDGTMFYGPTCSSVHTCRCCTAIEVSFGLMGLRPTHAHEWQPQRDFCAQKEARLLQPPPQMTLSQPLVRALQGHSQANTLR